MYSDIYDLCQDWTLGSCLWFGGIQARLLVDTVGDIRKNCNESFHCLLERALSFAREYEITMTKPRTSGR